MDMKVRLGEAQGKRRDAFAEGTRQPIEPPVGKKACGQ